MAQDKRGCNCCVAQNRWFETAGYAESQERNLRQEDPSEDGKHG